ncbi:hypothetical protein NMG60_11016929 [Bertholletia excelsa]
MAGIVYCCPSPLSNRSNLGTSWLVFEPLGRQTMTGKTRLRRRDLRIRAEVNYVSADEAKELVAGGERSIDE